jgi:hypothetical protein
MMPLCVQFLGSYRLTLPKIHAWHTAGRAVNYAFH